MARNTQRCIQLYACQLLDFSVLTVRAYQVTLAPSCVQGKLQRDYEEKIQFEMHRGDNRVLQSRVIKIRVFSWFRNASKHQVWIAYRPNGEDDVDYDMADDKERTPIGGYYCASRSGVRTLGTCADISSVLWFLGHARYQERIRYSSQRLIRTINDTENQMQTRDILWPEVIDI